MDVDKWPLVVFMAASGEWATMADICEMSMCLIPTGAELLSLRYASKSLDTSSPSMMAWEALRRGVVALGRNWWMELSD